MSLDELRSVMDIPAATEIDRWQDGVRIRALVDGGMTVAQAAAELGVSRRTAFRRLGTVESARNPFNYIKRVSGTLGTQPMGKEGAA